VICSISSLCNSECLLLHSTVKLIFSWSKATDRWQGARLSEFFWQHSRRRHLVRLLVPASTGFQPNTEHPLFISSLHMQIAVPCVIHNTASSVPLDMNKLVRAARLLTYFREVSDLNLDPTPTSKRKSFVVFSLPSCEMPKLYLAQFWGSDAVSPAVQGDLSRRDPLDRVSVGSLQKRSIGLD
jgi:hypothetical protein